MPWVLAPLALLALLASACATPMTSGQAIPTSTATALPTATPAPRVLYTADWSHGANGWTLPPHWSIQGGQLVNDGQGDDAIPIPFSPTESRYTVEMQAQVEGYTCSPNCNEYGFAADGIDGTHLYVAEIDEIGLNPPHHGFSMLTTPHPQDTSRAIATQDFIPGVNVRSYRVSVDGNSAFYAISESGVGAIEVAVPLSPVHLSITDQHVQLIVSSLTITTP